MNDRSRWDRTWVLVASAALLFACGDEPSAGEGDDVDRGSRDAAIVADVADGDDAGLPDAPEPARDVGIDVIDTTEPLPPVADAGGDRGGVPNVSIRFDGSRSTDPDGEIVAWAWNFGNGDTATGVIANYAYPSEGVFTVTLTVTDDQGLSDTDEIVVDLSASNVPPNAIIRGPFEVVAGEENEWNALESTDDVALVSWEWDVGVDDEAPITGQRLDYVYEDWGTYTMTLTVVDTAGVADLDTRSIDVLAPPVPVLDGPTQAFVGELVQFDGSASFDPDAEEGVAARGIVEYRWLWDDGTPPEVSGPFGSHVFAAEGSYNVSLIVTDRDGIERQSAARKVDIFEVPNVPPTPVISASAFVVDECEEVALDGSLSTDDVDPLSELRFIWDFGDGSALTGVSVRHAWERAGNYEVSLTAIDQDGDDAIARRTLTVENLVPDAQFTLPSDGLIGQPVTVDASASADFCEGDIVAYIWDFGDGTITEPSPSPRATHTYVAPDTYEVTLTVVDDNTPEPGEASRTQQIEIGADVAPVAVITAPSFTVDECEIVPFDGSLSVDDRDDVADLRFLWDFGDGSVQSGVDVEKAWTTEGIYDVTLNVTDTGGNAGDAVRSVTVENIPPTARFSAPPSVVLGQNLNVDASASEDGCLGEIVSYRWNWGDGVMSTGSSLPTASHSYDALGTYEVTLTVRDNGSPGVSRSTTQRINVVESAPGPQNYSVAPPVNTSCAFGLVNVQMNAVEITQTGDAITVDARNTQPGLMTGTRTGDTFTATNFIGTGGSFGCDERYTISGTFNPNGTITFSLAFEFSGTCFDCTNRVLNGTLTPA